MLNFPEAKLVTLDLTWPGSRGFLRKDVKSLVSSVLISSVWLTAHSWFGMIGISRGMSSRTCSYWVRAAHTLDIPLEHDPHVKGASTGAFGCHPPNGVCKRKIWTMRKRWFIQRNMLLSFTFKAFCCCQDGERIYIKFSLSDGNLYSLW